MGPLKKYVPCKIECFDLPSPISHFVAICLNPFIQCHSLKRDKLLNDRREFSLIYLATYANHIMSKEVGKDQKSHFLTISHAHSNTLTVYTQAHMGREAILAKERRKYYRWKWLLISHFKKVI